jgi:hypothetical protein
MMTPNNVEGRTTERIMAEVKKHLPDISTNDYNRVYESILTVLNGRGDIHCNHDWQWHSTGAGMGWSCSKCDGYKGF